MDVASMKGYPQQVWPALCALPLILLIAGTQGVGGLAEWLLDPRVAAAICLWFLAAEPCAGYLRSLLAEDTATPQLFKATQEWAGDTGDGLWHIRGCRYDLREFVDQHPGGRRAILLGLGTECTALFNSYHAFSDRPGQVLKNFYVDDHGVKPYYTWEPGSFSDEVHKVIREYFHTRKLPPRATLSAQVTMWAFFLAFLVSYFLLLKGFYAGLVMVPIFYWLSGSAMLHNGAHFAVSSRPWVNDLCAWIGSAHTSPLMWCQQHVVGHHQYPNHSHLDPDLHHFRRDTGVLKKELGWRCHRDHPVLAKYSSWRLAWLYVPAWTTFGISVIHDIDFFMSRCLYGCRVVPSLGSWRRAGHLLGRLLVITLGLYMPFGFVTAAALSPGPGTAMRIAFAIFKGIVFAVVPWGIHGLIYFVFSQVSHINGECFADGLLKKEEKSADWATHQVLSTWDYSVTNRFVGLVANGLNNQIVHHLCPVIHPCHFPALAPLVAAVASKHNLDVQRRQADTLWRSLRRLWAWLAVLNDIVEACT